MLAAAALTAAACAPSPRGGESRTQRPAIILLLVDTLRADHLSSYGFEQATSPNLDRLAEESVVFERFFSPSPWTAPSIGSLFTSLPPQIHGLNVFTEKFQFLDPDTGELRASVLPEQAVTLAELLRGSGYRTAAFVANPWLKDTYGLSQGFEVYDDHAISKTTPATVLLEDARIWLEQLPSGKPFFLYLHFMDVHDPYDAPRDDFEALWPGLSSAGSQTLEPSQMPPGYLEVEPAWAEAGTRRQLAYWRARYASGVRAFDRRIGPFLDFLQRTGILDSSYTVITSDHGEELFEHRGWSHGNSLYEHQLHVPLIVRAPAGRGGGRRVANVLGQIDLMPTLLELAGVESPATLHGSSFASQLIDGKGQRGVAFGTGILHDPGIYSLRNDAYKLIHDLESGESMLFDLAQDASEKTDLAAAKPAVTQRLEQTLSEYLERSQARGRMPPESAEISEEMRHRLEALGYLN